MSAPDRGPDLDRAGSGDDAPKKNGGNELGSFFSSKRKPAKASAKKSSEAAPAPDEPKAAPKQSSEEPTSDGGAEKPRRASPEPDEKPREESPEPSETLASLGTKAAEPWRPKPRRASPEPDEEKPRGASPEPEKPRRASPEPEPRRASPEPEPSREASPEPEEQEDQKVRDKENVSSEPAPARFAPATRRGAPALSFNPNISPEMESYRKPSEDELEEMKKKDPPLKSNWVIWEIRMKGKKESFDSGSVVASFGTVKGFWTYWNHMPQPSQLLEGKRFMRETPEGRTIVDCLMLFREGVKPEWEDPANATGGHFQIQLNPKLGGATIDEYWNNIVFGMVTGSIDPEEMICGVRLVDKLAISNPARQHVRLEVWFSNYKDTAKVETLQKNFEQCLCTKLDGTLSSDGPRIEVKKH